MSTNNSVKGFTLIELLIVIGILGVLAAAVVVVLNPAELLAQARDSQRLQDIDGVNSAISLYVASVASPSFTAGPFSTASTSCPDVVTCTVRAVYTTAGSGWVAVNLDGITGGSPLSTLPRDPTNDSTYQYVYGANNTTKMWELVANLESTKFANGGGSDKESLDGGDSSTNYEKGTDPGLDIL